MSEMAGLIAARLATLETVEMIATREGEAGELLGEIRRALALDARNFVEEDDDDEKQGRAAAA